MKLLWIFSADFNVLLKTLGTHLVGWIYFIIENESIFESAGLPLRPGGDFNAINVVNDCICSATVTQTQVNDISKEIEILAASPTCWQFA